MARSGIRYRSWQTGNAAFFQKLVVLERVLTAINWRPNSSTKRTHARELFGRFNELCGGPIPEHGTLGRGIPAKQTAYSEKKGQRLRIPATRASTHHVRRLR
jgi:hypothetical protein